jgi:P4 family phage/plasmid primase-like protien
MNDSGKSEISDLMPMHLAELRDGSGLSDETICRAGLHTERDHHKLATYTGKAYPKARGDALVFPFLDLDGRLNGYRRLKPLFPAKDRNGRAIKYLSPKGAGNRAYMTREALAVRENPQGELVIPEGEKKALKLAQEGFPAIGLTGVYSWKDGRKADRLIPDLEAFAWQGRLVYIVFDSDLTDKPEVRDAESRLAAQLKSRGARVKCVRIPYGPEGAKQGADDFLVRHGRVEFRKLLDKAVDPDDVDKDAGKVQAKDLDPMPEARKFLERNASHGGVCTLRFHRGFYNGWTGRKYREISETEMKATLRRYLDVFAFQIGGGTISNILASIEALTFIREDVEIPCWLDESGRGNGFIAMQNGILDIEAFLRDEADVLLPHSPHWFSTVCLPYAFDPAAKCPTWHAALERNLEADEDRIAVLQEWAGLNFVRCTGFQKYLTITGDGGNGKSVFCAGLTAMLGEENVCHLPLEAFGERFKLWETYGKLANIAAEVGEIDRVAEGTLKQFTSGDRMGFERKYADTVCAIPTARVTLSTNTLPRYSDRTSGIWRRQIVVPFRVQITEAEKVRDMDKPAWWKNAGELPGMLLWALVGLARLRKQGRFTQSDVCDAELATYRRECNPAALFLTENVAANVSGDMVTADVYLRYSTWCEANGFRRLASNSFGKEIQRAFAAAKQATVWNHAGRRSHGYQGVSLIDEIQNSPCNP